MVNPMILNNDRLNLSIVNPMIFHDQSCFSHISHDISMISAESQEGVIRHECKGSTDELQQWLRRSQDDTIGGISAAVQSGGSSPE